MGRASELKLQGFIRQKEKRYYSVRLKAAVGNVTSEQMAKVSEMATRYGRGYASLTARMSIEIPWVEREDLDEIRREAEDVGLAVGGMGATVRPITACKGTVCNHGLADTQGLGRRLDEEFFGRKLPAKLKMGIAGCPNDCTKAELNDIGFICQSVPVVDASLCVECNRCVSDCASLSFGDDGKITLDRSTCSNCGHCIQVCPSQAITAGETGYAVSLGGRFGRAKRIGQRVGPLQSPDDAVAFTRAVIDYMEENARPKERLGEMIDRIGINELLRAVLKNSP